MPALPAGRPNVAQPAVIFQVRTAEQLSAELAEEKPDYLYVPLDVMIESFELLAPFTARGCVPVAVLPRVITDGEAPKVEAMCYAPFDDPQIAIAIVVEHSGAGASLGPIAKDILNTYFDEQTAANTTEGELTILK